MTQLNPSDTTVADLVLAALKAAGAIGVGQTPSAEDTTDGWAHLQWMLQTWQRKRWLVYHLVTIIIDSTGAIRYPLGPVGTSSGIGGDFGPDFNDDFSIGQEGFATSGQRPDKIESAFLRQLTQSQPNQIDYPLTIVHSMEDYNRIALKGLVSFPGVMFYDPAFPTGWLYPWPIPQANIYAIGVTLKELLPTVFPTAATKVILPAEYFNAIVYNLALRLRPKYGLGTYPGDMVPGLAKDGLNVLKGANTAIAELVVDPAASRRGIYNIFSDTFY